MELRSARKERSPVIYEMVRKGYNDKQRLEIKKKVVCISWNFPGRRNSTCKGLGMGPCVVCLRDSTRAFVTGSELARWDYSETRQRQHEKFLCSQKNILLLVAQCLITLLDIQIFYNFSYLQFTFFKGSLPLTNIHLWLHQNNNWLILFFERKF